MKHAEWLAGASWVVAGIVALGSVSQSTNAQTVIETQQRINDEEGGLTGPLTDGDSFGSASAALGDLNGDGVPDIAVGARGDDDGGPSRGAVWILFLDATGAVASEQKISDTAGGFGGVLENGDSFGASLAPLGDLDGDGIVDLAVGAPDDDDPGSRRGTVWILFLNADGTVRDETRISAMGQGFAGAQEAGRFGTSLAALNDLDGDGNPELASGAPSDDDGADQAGAVWILFLNEDGTVADSQKISATVGDFAGELEADDRFGSSVANLGDLDGDRVEDLAVGATGDDDGASGAGAIWILFLNDDGTVQAEQKISATEGGFDGSLDAFDEFGGSLATLSDLDADGVPELAAGAPGDDDGGTDRGAVWELFMNADGTVKSSVKISNTMGGFSGDLADGDRLGSSIASPGDFNGDGTLDLTTGAVGDDGGGSDRGAVWNLIVLGPEEENNPGSGVNPNVLVAGDNPPRLGIVWDPIILPIENGVSDPLFHFLAVSDGLVPIESNLFEGELLIDLEPPNPLIFKMALPGDNFAIPIIPDSALLGLECFTQGAILDVDGVVTLTNGLNILIGQ